MFDIRIYKFLKNSPIQAKPTRASTLELRRTSTGILSNRPHIDGTPVSSGATTPIPSLDDAAGASTPRPSLLALAKREAARRGLYARFFRGPILEPDDVQSQMVKTEPTATPQMPSHRDDDDMKKGSKRKRKIDARGDEDILRAEERNRERRLRKDAEKTARKLKRHKEKHNASSTHADESILWTLSQEQGSGLLISTSTDEVPRARREKKKRFKVASVDEELDARPTLSADERTLEGEARGKLGRKDFQDCSRKRRRRDQSP